MEQKKYMDIKVLNQSMLDWFKPGEHIVVQEKIDGANFSIRYDPLDNTVKAFSRKTQLSCENDLRGGWQWSQNLDVDKVKSVLGDNLILFMEWLVPHTVVYPKERHKNAYCYDIYDTDTQAYLAQSAVKEKVRELGLIYVPVFYDGEFTSWDDLRQFIGTTKLGGEYGEGIVVKNQDRMPLYTKIVTEKFRETKRCSHKTTNPELLAERERVQKIVESVVTEARVEKILNKMVDYGVIPEDWNEHDMGVIARNIGKEVYQDCIKEEYDIVEQAGDMFGKLVPLVSMRIVREMLKERNAIVA